MKKFNYYVFVVLSCLLLTANLPVKAETDVSISVNISSTSDFYAPLSVHGSWVEVGNYGTCWRPFNISTTWRPYCEGQWVWTDYGWYWSSEEPWGWATYHYGYWINDPFHSWIWVPGIEWGPSWVSWRIGGGYIGWVPYIPPHIVIIHQPVFVFVRETHFCNRIRPSTVIINNTTIINQTTVVNNIKHERTKHGRIVTNRGPDRERIQRTIRREVPVSPIKVIDRKQFHPNPRRVEDPPYPKVHDTPNVQRIERPIPQQIPNTPRRIERPIPTTPPTIPNIPKRVERPTPTPTIPNVPPNKPIQIPPRIERVERPKQSPPIVNRPVYSPRMNENIKQNPPSRPNIPTENRPTNRPSKSS